jgi:hypothetical protein
MSKHALRYLDNLVTNDLRLLSTMPPNRTTLDDIVLEFLDLAGSSDIFLHLEAESYLRFQENRYYNPLRMQLHLAHVLWYVKHTVPKNHNCRAIKVQNY